MIHFESVTKRYPDGTIAVDELDLIAPSGQITVLVGPSGCGKTTCLCMIKVGGAWCVRPVCGGLTRRCGHS
jgi:ABC-type Fe3+/spermidine/putrescine transport system ATPase subunit